MYQSYINAKDFLNYAGYDLSLKLVRGDEPNQNKVIENFLNQVALMIYDYLPVYIRDEFYEDIKYREVLKNAQLYQATYLFENGDIYNKIGLTVIRSGYIDIEQLRGDRYMSPSAIKVLKSTGVFLRGVKLC